MARPAPIAAIVDGNCARIPIMGRGGVVRAWAFIDAADLPLLGTAAWCMTAAGYPIQRRGTRIVYLHRVIMPGDGVADHISGDKLDCRRANLRRCSQLDNSRNTRRQVNNTSGFKGVRETARGRFNARITVARQNIHIGNYLTAEEAARAYDAAATEHFGEFACLNFPAKIYAETAGVDVLIKPHRPETA